MVTRVILPGGSNSVVSHALRAGLAEGAELTNLALGASSCMQNLHALLGRPDRLSRADSIVTESNVNDSFVSRIGLGIDFLVRNIEAYYAALASIGLPIVVLVLPLNRSPAFRGKIETVAVSEAVNDAHRRAADRHGFGLIDMAEAWAGIDQDELDFLMPDWRHPNLALMHSLGRRIAAHLDDLPPGPRADPAHVMRRYRVLTAESLGLATQMRTNSLFSEGVAEIGTDPVTVHIDEPLRLLGVASWSQRMSFLELGTQDRRLVKPNASIFAFSEIASEFAIGGPLTLRSVLAPDAVASERTLLVPPGQAPLGPAGLVGFLCERPDAALPPAPPPRGRIDLGALIPDHRPYAASIRFHLARNAAG